MNDTQPAEAQPYWIEDPGHGWLVVPTSILVYAQGHGLKVSPYSYVDRSRGLVYLEEDDDAPALGDAIKWGTEKMIAFEVRHIDSMDDRIRRHGLVPYNEEVTHGS